MLTMTEAKKLAKTNLAEAAGQEFTPEKSEYLGGGPTGVVGVILPSLSVRGKPQAELTCTVEGCTEKHVREISDWHQSTRCESHAKSKSKGKSASPGTGGGRSLKMPDGEVFREMKISDSDPEDVKEAKRQNNELFEQLYAQEQARRDEEKAAAAEARKAKQAEERAAREAKQAEEKKAAILAQRERALKYAQEKGLPVSPKLLSAE